MKRKFLSKLDFSSVFSASFDFFLSSKRKAPKCLSPNSSLSDLEQPHTCPKPRPLLLLFSIRLVGRKCHEELVSKLVFPSFFSRAAFAKILQKPQRLVDFSQSSHKKERSLRFFRPENHSLSSFFCPVGREDSNRFSAHPLDSLRDFEGDLSQCEEHMRTNDNCLFDNKSGLGLSGSFKAKRSKKLLKFKNDSLSRNGSERGSVCGRSMRSFRLAEREPPEGVAHFPQEFEGLLSEI